jgi:hypothetical protein
MRLIAVVSTVVVGSCDRAQDQHDDLGEGESKAEAIEGPEIERILKGLGLERSSHRAGDDEAVRALEAADARSYESLDSGIWYLRSEKPSDDSDGSYPRYWLNIEKYRTNEAAERRAEEYRSVDAYERLEEVPIWGSRASKFTIRLWAVARGATVYALTTDAGVFSYDPMQKRFHERLVALGE